jgi:hypothetical protein
MITITTTPQNYSPIYNDYIWGVNTDLSPLPPNFKYVADVYINDAFVRRMKVFPNKLLEGIFRLDRICQDYVSYFLIAKPDIAEPFFDCSFTNSANIKVVFSEEYGSLSTGTTVYTATSTTSATRVFYNGALSYFGDVKNNKDIFNFGVNNRGATQYFIGYDANTFVAIPISTTGFPGKFMTDSPRTLWMDYWEIYQVHIQQDTDYMLGRMVVKTYDFNNTLINTYNYQNLTYLQPILTGTSNSAYILACTIGPRDINSLEYSFGSAPNINQNVKYYEVYFEFDDGVAPTEQTTEKFTIYLKQKTYYEKFRLVWLNNYGVFDRYTFEGRNLQTKGIKENKEIQNILGVEIAGGQLQYGFGANLGREIIYRSVDNTYNVFSQFLKRDESYWLNQLYTSSQAYLEICEERNDIIFTKDRGGLMEIYFSKPHYYQLNDLIALFDCTNGNNKYGSIAEVIDEKSIYTDIPYSSITDGFTSRIANQNKHLPIIVNDKSYAIRQGINPRNIQLQINFSLANEDPKQSGGYNKRADPYSI